MAMDIQFDEVTYTAPDISCEHCVATIKRTVGALPGVETVDADATTKKVGIVFDPERVTRQQLEAALDEEGYPVASS